MEMRIKKRPSITKVNKQQQKMMSMTFSTNIFPTSNKEIKLPTIKRQLRQKLPKIAENQIKTVKQIKQTNQRKQTQTTMTQSSMFQSYYQTMGKNWIKPSDYIKDIKQLNLFQEDNININQYQIKLTQKVQKNIQKIQALFKLTQKWIAILKRALFYVSSKKSTSDKLIQQIKFWKELSKKFDQLQYQFNNQKTESLQLLMKNSLKMNPQYKKLYSQFVQLKDKVVSYTVPIKKLYLSLQEIVAGLIHKFEQSSCIIQSLNLLKNILFGFHNLSSTHPFLQTRLQIIYKKMDLCLIQKLLAASIYPRQLANISGFKQRYQLLDKSLSFYYNFISVMEEAEQPDYENIIQRAQYSKNTIMNLLEILCYFQYLYNKKQVLQFSKLSSYLIDFNIFDIEYREEWNEYMETLHKSMEIYHYES